MLEELFTFQNPRLTPDLEQASDENSGLLSQGETTQASLLHRGLQDTLSLGSFYAFLPAQAPKPKQGEENPETGRVRTSSPNNQRQKRICLTCFRFSIHAPK